MTSTSEQEPDQAGEKILVVDDDPTLLLVAKTALTKAGFTVMTAGDGAEGVEVAAWWRPELILLDLMMPALDGIEVLRRLRHDPRTAATTVIVLSGKGEYEAVIEALESGADQFLLKPLRSAELVLRVKAAILRAREHLDRNPLTKLPGNFSIRSWIQRKIETEEPFAIMHIDLDNFKAFNDKYGFVRGDDVLKATGVCLQDQVVERGGAGAFLGNVGGDDFAAICSLENAKLLAQGIIEAFDKQIRQFYDEEDLKRGFLQTRGRTNEVQVFPIMTISIGIATSASRDFATALEAVEVANEMKRVAKARSGSTYALDRRGRFEKK